MKLTETQIAEIEKYILDWEIEYREFFDEMLDHFVTDIEGQMNNGSDFYSAFRITAGKFSGKTFDKRKHEKYFGLKAFEMESIYDFQKSYNQLAINVFKNQALSFRVFIWGCIGYFLFQNFILVARPIFTGFYIGALFQTVIIFFISKPRFSFNKFKNIKDLNLNERKNLLKSKMKIGAMTMTYNLFTLFILNFFNLLNALRGSSLEYLKTFNLFNYLLVFSSIIALFISYVTMFRFTNLKFKIQWP